MITSDGRVPPRAVDIAEQAPMRCLAAELLSRREPEPPWPRGMAEKIAARYVGVSVSTLRAEVQAWPLLRTKVTARRFVYLKERLDTWLDAKDAAGRPRGKSLMDMLDDPALARRGGPSA